MKKLTLSYTIHGTRVIAHVEYHDPLTWLAQVDKLQLCREQFVPLSAFNRIEIDESKANVKVLKTRVTKIHRTKMIIFFIHISF